MIDKSSLSVLVVDDSAAFRIACSTILPRFAGIADVITARDPYEARSCMVVRMPDVILLDIGLPRMDGLTFLKLIMEKLPLPVLIISNRVNEDPQMESFYLRAGALAALPKPNGVQQGEYYHHLARLILDAAHVKRETLVRTLLPESQRAPIRLSLNSSARRDLIVLGCSTGGPESLERIIGQFPGDSPAMLIVQHMPARFTAMLANRLDQVSSMRVTEAKDGDRLIRGSCLIGPGGKHLVLSRAGTELYVELQDGPREHGCIPSVDVLFRSVARHAAGRAVAAVLTGMGRDGAQGAVELRKAGNLVIAQDEESSIVYGMPKEAAATGAMSHICPLDEIPKCLLGLLSQ